MYDSKNVDYGYKEKEKRLNFFLSNEKYISANSSTYKNIEQKNLEKCELASILLDNFSTFEQISLIEEGKYSNAKISNDLNLLSCDDKNSGKYSTHSNSTNRGAIFDLHNFRAKKDNGIHFSNTSSCDIITRGSDRYSSRDRSDSIQRGINANYGNNECAENFCMEVDSNYERIEDKSELVCSKEITPEVNNGKDGGDKSYNDQWTVYEDTFLSNIDIADLCKYFEQNNFERHKCQNVKKHSKEKKKENMFSHKLSNKKRGNKSNSSERHIFDLTRREKKELGEDKKENCQQANNKNIKIIKKNSYGDKKVYYEKRLKEQTLLHKEEKEKMKKIYEMQIYEIMENYKREEEKKKMLINNIYNKYMNMKNELIKETNDKKNLQDMNENLKNELKTMDIYPLENNLLNSYKNKIEDYIFLSKNKDIKIKNLENEISKIKKCLDQVEKKYCQISEEKKNLHEMNALLRKDNIHLQKRLENLKNEKNEMGQVLFYKDLKINHFLSILNVLDEAIMSDSTCSSEKQQKKEKQETTNVKGTKKGEKGEKTETDAIRSMNKKIIIKSIVHKIKDLNKKIKKHEKVLSSSDNKVSHHILQINNRTSQSNNSTIDEVKRDKELIDNYFNCTNYILNENETNMPREDEGQTTFFTNTDSKGATELSKNSSDQHAQTQNEENISVVLNKQE
ncbi:hypothetical protein MKS88_001218 [Plasmodium brasilianum]|nr:hypothetical protein MKS88_001218 [Plasmodium brasilianum]SBS82577.1 conserved Plasmodium protein, unknown function [Plasmodium malariae]